MAMAKKWNNVPDQISCNLAGLMKENESVDRSNDIDDNDIVEIIFDVSSCNIAALEHVQALINVNHPNRGSIEVVLVSGAGTKTRLLSPRPKDTSEKGFKNWSLMSVETWGERPGRWWQLYIVNHDKAIKGDWLVGESTLVLHGTQK